MNHISPRGQRPPFVLALLALSLSASFQAQGAPVGGVVAAGTASIATQGAQTTITQGTAGAVINWQGFGIAAGEAVRFQQPSSSAVVLNRVLGPDPSAIFGTLSANGKVFLVNPGGVLFGAGASVNVGGLVASTLNIGDQDFMAGRYSFNGSGRGTVVNQGTITADGGYVALLGTDVTNQGSISARLGSVALAAGQAVTLDVLGDKLLQVTVDRGAVDALVRNGGLLQADGGQVLLTTQAAGSLLSSVVNNTGVIRAQTISTQNGTIKLLGGMVDGVVDLAGRLDASAPAGGDGGFIETSAGRVRVRDGAQVTTASAFARTGDWLIDPQDFTIGSGATDNISGPTLSALLVTNSVTITTAPGPTVTTLGTPPTTSLNTSVEGNGDIHVNEAVSWTATPSTTTLTLNATRDVNINRAITAVNGNLVVCCGRDVNVNAPVTTTRGSVLLSAGRNATFAAPAAMTTTDGNIMVCAANDISIASAFTLTRGSSIPERSLGLPAGLVLSAGNGGTGPGEAGGTVRFAPLAPRAAITGPNAAVTVNYNPVNYTTPTDFAGNFTLDPAAVVDQRMLVFGSNVPKMADGTTTTTLAGLKGNPLGVVLVAGPGSTANFDTPLPGVDKPITFTGYTLAGPDAGRFALPMSCCGPVVGRTLGTLLAAAVPVVPPVVPPAVVAPVPVPIVIVPPPVVAVVPPLLPVLPLPVAPIPVPARPVAPVPEPLGPVAPGPVAPVPVPTVPPATAVPPLLVTSPTAEVAPEPDLGVGDATSAGGPQFVPFLVSPVLLRTASPLLVFSPAAPAPVELVLVQAPVQEAPAPLAAPAAPRVVAPAATIPIPAPAAPAYAPRPYRN